MIYLVSICFVVECLIIVIFIEFNVNVIIVVNQLE